MAAVATAAVASESDEFAGYFWFVGRTCWRRRRKAEETAVKALFP